MATESWMTRLLGGMLVIAMSIPLWVANRLTPSPSGLGTHHQLGLPPCSMRVLWSMRCPACGMTTSWSHITRGNLIAAWQANAGGVLLAFLAFGLVLVGLRMLVESRLPSPRVRTALAWSLLLIGAVTAVDWTLRTWGGVGES